MGGGASKMNQTTIDMSHFDVQRVIGAGGFGKVKAVQKKSTPDKDVYYAMKLLDKNIAVKLKIGASQIMNERDRLSDLDNPWIICSKYCFEDMSFAYIVMDICLGGDLRYRMKKSGGFIKEKQVIFYSCQLVFALMYIHQQNMIHCDIKPENVVLASDGYVKLTDFGFAASLNPQGFSVCIGGTGGYMAPETYSKTKLQSRPADWFSLGVTIWEMLTGHRPFDGRSIGKGGWAPDTEITEERWPKIAWEDLTDAKYGLSEETGTLLKALMALNIKDRIGTTNDEELLDCKSFKDIHSGIMSKTIKPEFMPDVSSIACRRKAKRSKALSNKCSRC
jgi:serine/threonine protein kinase